MLGELLGWKLVFRDPLPTWVSPHGRIALLGDAAHPHLPTSIQGASQAIEDGATLAQTLWLAGGTKDDVPLALRAYQEIWHDCCTRMSRGVAPFFRRGRWRRQGMEREVKKKR